MKAWCLTYMSLVLALCSMAQERSLSISTDRELFMIGEKAVLEVVLRSHASDTVAFPVIGDTIISELEVLERSKLDTNYEGDDLSQRVFTQRITFTSFDTGYFPITPRIATINGKEVLSNPLLVSIATVEVDTSKGIYDIKGVAEAPFSLKEWLIENQQYFYIGIPLLILIVLLSLWLARRKPEEVVEPVVPPVIAHVRALERLDQLKQQELWQKGEIKHYYSELTEILREYIEYRFLVPALEQTTDEIHASLRRNPDIGSPSLSQLKQLLFLADLVKFAKEKPESRENEMNLQMAYDFVQETKREEVEHSAENLPPKTESSNGDRNG